MRLTLKSVATIAAIGLLSASGADAHVFGEHAGGFVAGAAHPFSGLDHVLAMVAVGLWAAQSGARAPWAIPLAFLAAMGAGSAVALAGFALPHVEAGIAASVLVLGLVVAAALRLPVSAGAAVAGMFAAFHGYAHGAEFPAMVAPVTYAAGFLIATAALIGAGYASGRRLGSRAVRFAGVCVAVTGAAMLAG